MQTLPIRLPRNNERGDEFIEWLDERLGGNRAARQRMEAFIQEWDHLRDEIRDVESGEPTVEDYSHRWGVAVSSAYRLLDEFRSVLGVEYPGVLCDLLWEGMPKTGARGYPPRKKWLLAVRVIDDQAGLSARVLGTQGSTARSR